MKIQKTRIGRLSKGILSVVVAVILATPVHAESAWIYWLQITGVKADVRGNLTVRVDRAPSNPREGVDDTTLSKCTSELMFIDDDDPIKAQRLFDMAKQAMTLKQRVNIYAAETPDDSTSNQCQILAMWMWPPPSD
ncbi:MAG: hypothetical protein OXG15_03185 [Gammaproteobacteria bacterium]|nr:hypothetical protein [Gammaproteobacteria bacterium]